MWIFLGAAIIGLTLGLLGSGGSAITVPVLVYLVGHSTKQAIAESMAIVGIISAVAAIPYGRAGLIDWHHAWYFGIPGMVGTFIGAWLGGMSPEALQLVVFGGVLVLAAASMVRKSPAEVIPETKPASLSAVGVSVGVSPPTHHSPIWKIATEGAIVGIVTGFVGVGGGFLIVPALFIFARLPIRKAIATSLVIIALKSFVGLITYQQYLVAHNSSVDLSTIILFSTIGLGGSLVGQLLNSRMNQRLLRLSFAVFLVVLGGWVIYRESGNLWSPPASKTTPGEVSENSSGGFPYVCVAPPRVAENSLVGRCEYFRSNGPHTRS